jgi:asparagine synthase (glutamine-hydrolysing)
MDEPVAISTIVQTAYVAALARIEGVPVLLNGEAGDELFLGYDHYRLDRIVDRYRRIPGLLRNTLLNPIFERLPARFDNLRKLARKAQQTDPSARYLEWLRLIELERMPELLVDSVLATNARGAIAETVNPFLAMPKTKHADRIVYTGLRPPLAEKATFASIGCAWQCRSNPALRWKTISWSNWHTACHWNISCDAAASRQF